MMHGTIILGLLRNSLLPLSFIIGLVAGRLSMIHTISLPALINLQSSSHLSCNSVSCFPPTLLLNLYVESVTQPQPFRSFSLFSPLSIPPFALVSTLCPLLSRQTRRQTGGEDIRWCTTRLERKNGSETCRGEEDA